MECVADVGAILGEGPVWVAAEKALYWVDIVGGKLFRWSEGAGSVPIPIARPLCSIVPRKGGGYLGGAARGIVAIAADFGIEQIIDPEPDMLGNRFNDGKVDRVGRFWAGTMDAREQGVSGSLYRIDLDFTCTRIDSGYTVTNGPSFSIDGRTMYHTDSGRQTVYAFDLDAHGNASDRRVFAQFGAGDGYPDGMTVDADGCLWIAFWDGWCVRRLSPHGERLMEIPIPVQRPTSCAFGGAALDELYITSARRALGAAELAQQPQAGGVFRCRPGVTGLAELPFAG